MAHMKNKINGKAYDTVFWIWIISCISGIFGGYRIHLGKDFSGIALTVVYILGNVLVFYPRSNLTQLDWTVICVGAVLIFSCFFYWLSDGIKLFGMKKSSL